MRLVIVGAVLSLLARRSEAQAPPPVTTRELRNVIPAAAAVEQFVVTPDSQRTYYRLITGGIWMYDRAANTTSQITDAAAWDLVVSLTKDVLAYTKVGDSRREQFVWIVPLSAATGLRSGKERQLSTHAGDVPSISPDGKRVAFARDDETGVGQSVVVVPVAGGSERVVASTLPSSVSNIRWTPDGKTIYFGVNPPVPFTCAESCLTGARESRPPATIRRVASTGGAVETIATVGLPAPGLSPDGKFIVFGDTGAPRRLVVADADGRRLKTFTLPGTQNQHGWAGSSTLLTLATGQSRRLRTQTLPDGASRVAFETADFLLEPSWTPDSRSVAATRYGNTGCELKVVNSDGSAPRTISLAKLNGCVNVSWTSDQRWVVFTNYRGQNEKPVLMAVEAATGQSKDLRSFSENDPAPWVLDRDVALIAEPIRDGNGTRRAIWQVDLTGSAKLLREIPVEDGGSLTIVDRNQVIVTRKASRDLRVVALASGEERTITVAASGFVSPRLSVSADRQWVGVFSGADNARLTRLELVKLDQSVRRTIDLPIVADAATPPLVLPGATGAVVAERRAPDQPANVHFVNTSANATKLFTYVVMGRPAELALSPDGRTIVYLLTEQPPPTISAIDITTIR